MNNTDTDTPTPETDAIAFYARQCFRPLEHVVPVEHTRKLERQRDALLSALETILYHAPQLNGPGGTTARQAIAAVKGNTES